MSFFKQIFYNLGVELATELVKSEDKVVREVSTDILGYFVKKEIQNMFK